MNIFEQIKIGSSFDAKGFKQAISATQKLDKAGKNLGRTLARTLGTAAVLAYSKASVKAYVEDENAARSLGQTLKNLGLAYGSNAGTVNGYISRLEAQTGVLDDELRPAMDRLLRATSSITKAQELLGLALDISAGTGKDLTSVTQALQKAYLGNTASLSKLGVGLSKAELTSSSFADIQAKLTLLFAGQSSSAAESYAGQLDKLTVAANNAKETIGKGLVDALVAIGGTGTSGGAVAGIDKLATGIADTLKNVGGLIDKLKELKPVLFAIGAAAAIYFAPITTAIVGAIYLLGQFNKLLDKSLFKQGIIPGGMGNISMTTGSQDTQRADKIAADKAAAKSAAAIAKSAKEAAAAQAKITKDKKLGIAIDKANLALGKGTNLFDLDAIQINAALINQAEQLGKVTNAAQLLSITTDIARLKIKQDIANLEDAIASKDEARITAATNQLNKDLLIYSALSNQNLKLADIKSILDSLLPKDLINQANLDAALAKIKEMLALLAQVTGTNTTTKKVIPPSGGGALSTVEQVAAITAKLPASVSASDWFSTLTPNEKAQLGGYVPFLGANIPSSMPESSFGSGAGLGNNGSGRQIPVQANYTVNVYAGTIANPDELSGLIQDTIIRLNKQGDYLTTAGAL